MLSIRTLVAFSETEVDDVNGVLCSVSASNQEVVRLDVTMNDSLLVDNLDSLNHLDGDMENGLEIELSSALLEEILERLTQHVHNHDMIHFSILSLFVTNEVQVRNRSFASQLVNELTLPEKHDVLLIFDCLFDFGSQIVTSLLFLDLVDISKSTSTEFFYDLVPLI